MNSNQDNKYIGVDNAIVIDTRKHFEVTSMYKLFLNQARAWFPNIDPVWPSVCVSAPEVINKIWRDMDHKRLVIKVLQLLCGNCSRYH